MIKIKGIEETDLMWNYESPPKLYKKIAKTPDSDGTFKVEVYKLKSFNLFTKEAVYIKQKGETLKSLMPAEQPFNPVVSKKRSFNIED
jgi:hypothetical protein